MSENLQNFIDGSQMARRIAREALARGVSSESLIGEAIAKHQGQGSLREILEKAFPPTLTDDFVETFATDQDCTGGMARIVATGMLPDGVDPEDPRVKDVIERCKRMKEVPPSPATTSI